MRVAGGLLFELLGQSAGDPFSDEDDIPVVLRSWQAQNFLITSLHVKGPISNINILGITEVQVIFHERLIHFASLLEKLDICLNYFSGFLFNLWLGASDNRRL